MSDSRARRLCVAVDMERYSSRNDLDQDAAQRRLAGLMDHAYHEALADRAGLARQPNGDGEVALLPPALDESRFMADFVRALRITLFRVNRELNRAARLRLRLAAHYGVAWTGEQGFVGQTVVRTCRLLDATRVRDALRDHPGSDLVVVVSDSLYEDAIRPDRYDIRATRFRRVRIESADKDFAADAWMWPADGWHDEPAQRSPAPPGQVTVEPTRVFVPIAGQTAGASREAEPHPGMRVTVHEGGSVHTVIQVNEVTGGIIVAPPGHGRVP